MHRGYLKLWRKIEDSGLLQIPNTYALFSYLLLHASHKPRKIGTPHGIVEIDRGQFISGRIALAANLKQSEQQIRTSLSRLEKMEIITIKTTSAYSVYTIVNYSNYQDDENKSTSEQPTNNQQSTSNQPTNNQQSTTKQELKHLSIEALNIKPIQNLLSTPAEKPPKVDPIPYQQIVDIYHQILHMCPKVAKLSAKRKGQIAARWRNGDLPDLETWREYFEFVAQSAFLTGKSDPAPGRSRFVADLEWLTNESNFIKTWEKKYHGR